MNKNVIALALALSLTGTLVACGTTSNTPDNNTNGSMGSGSAVPGQVSRRYDRNRSGTAWDYLDDGRYTAGSSGKVYGGDGNPVSRDLTRGARDIVRDTGDAMGDIGRGVGNAAKDIGKGVSNAARDMGKGADNVMTGKY